MVNYGYYESHEHLPNRRRKKSIGSEGDPNGENKDYRNDYGL